MNLTPGASVHKDLILEHVYSKIHIIVQIYKNGL